MVEIPHTLDAILVSQHLVSWRQPSECLVWFCWGCHPGLGAAGVLGELMCCMYVASCLVCPAASAKLLIPALAVVWLLRC